MFWDGVDVLLAERFVLHSAGFGALVVGGSRSHFLPEFLNALFWEAANGERGKIAGAHVAKGGQIKLSIGCKTKGAAASTRHGGLGRNPRIV